MAKCTYLPTYLQKDIILLLSVSFMFCQAGPRTSVGNNRFIKFSLSRGTYSIDDFNAKIRVPVLQERQDWEPPQIKDLKLVIPAHCTFMVSNINFIALGILGKYLEKTTQIKSTLLSGLYKASLDTSPPPKSLSLHCKQINKVKNKLHEQLSSLLACMNVSNYKTTFSKSVRGHFIFNY